MGNNEAVLQVEGRQLADAFRHKVIASIGLLNAMN